MSSDMHIDFVYDLNGETHKVIATPEEVIRLNGQINRLNEMPNHIQRQFWAICVCTEFSHPKEFLDNVKKYTKLKFILKKEYLEVNPEPSQGVNFSIWNDRYHNALKVLVAADKIGLEEAIIATLAAQVL